MGNKRFIYIRHARGSRTSQIDARTNVLFSLVSNGITVISHTHIFLWIENGFVVVAFHLWFSIRAPFPPFMLWCFPTQGGHHGYGNAIPIIHADNPKFNVAYTTDIFQKYMELRKLQWISDWNCNIIVATPWFSITRQPFHVWRVVDNKQGTVELETVVIRSKILPFLLLWLLVNIICSKFSWIFLNFPQLRQNHQKRLCISEKGLDISLKKTKNHAASERLLRNVH